MAIAASVIAATASPASHEALKPRREANNQPTCPAELAMAAAGLALSGTPYGDPPSPPRRHAICGQCPRCRHAWAVDSITSLSSTEPVARERMAAMSGWAEAARPWRPHRNYQALDTRGPAFKRADSGDCGQVFRLIADTDSDRSRTAFRRSRTVLPSAASRVHSAVSVSSLVCLPDFSGGLRRVSPSSARRCAVCTRRSRTASAIVGSTITSCQ